jgi:hypothetical protein
LSLAVFLAVDRSAPAQAPTKTDWISLFNGKDLTGWTPKIKGYDAGVNYANTYRVENGILKVGYDGYSKFDGKFGHLFYNKPFSHYRLRVEYRFVGDQCPGAPGWAFRNSGVMIHSQSAKSMRKDQEFPVSIEVQYLGGGPNGERPTANVCSPGTHIVMDGKLIKQHCNNSTAKTYRGDQWVTVEVEVHGAGKIRHIVEGKTVLEYEQPQLDTNDRDAAALVKGSDTLLREGYLALQAESHPIEFRKVEILPLDE